MGKKDISIRLAKSSDVHNILEIIKENPNTILERSEPELNELLPTTWVAEVDGQIAGCATLEIYSPKIAEVRTVAVRETFRGLGIGKLLVEAAVAEGEARGVKEILVVTSSPEFFQKLNFGACLNEKYALFWLGKNKRR